MCCVCLHACPLHVHFTQSPKAQTLRAVVRTQFRANMYETNEALAKELRERSVLNPLSSCQTVILMKFAPQG